MQIFSRNPRAWASRRLRSKEIEQFRNKLRETEIWPVAVHTPYLLNLASPRKAVYRKSVEVLKDELIRAGQFGISYIVTHLGSHLGYGREAGFERLLAAIKAGLCAVNNDVILLLENTAGTRNSVGSSFEDIRRILDGTFGLNRIDICFDTCHAFAAGYDLVSAEAVRDTLRRFDRTVGLSRIKLVHLNDSRVGLGGGVDRHEHIGMGRIGEEGFRYLLTTVLGRVPLILETPIDGRRTDLENLQKVRELIHVISDRDP